jgi:DNA invertase Pin-like site-specific DNA recombinase
MRLLGDDPWSVSLAGVQQWQLSRWAANRGWRIRVVVEEPTVTESSDARPVLRTALDRVESRESDGIVTVRLKHIGASLAEVLNSIERIQAAGGVFVSVGDGIDLSTRTGRLILRALVSVSDW